ncbi:MAG: hypothetical protein JW783_00365 [Bacteroidales bacterium]|nr:hypothetical protein [Bacteroidales bacterium]MBN2748474.1 hypothetical protein [Bacteroidales bacterium]
MKSYLLITILSFSILAGCRSTRVTTKEDVKSNEVESALSTSNASTRSSLSVSASVIDLSVFTDSTEREVEVVKWSAPDSSGKQYPVETTRITEKVRQKKQNNTAATNSVNSQQKDTLAAAAATSRNASSERQTTNDERREGRSTAWITWGAVILSLGAVFLLYLVLARFGLVKRFLK